MTILSSLFVALQKQPRYSMAIPCGTTATHGGACQSGYELLNRGSEIVLIRRSCKPCFPNYLSKGESPLDSPWMCRNTAPLHSFLDKLNFPTCPPMDASQLGNSKCCPGWLMFALYPSAGKFDCPTDLPRDASLLGKRPIQAR